MRLAEHRKGEIAQLVRVQVCHARGRGFGRENLFCLGVKSNSLSCRNEAEMGERPRDRKCVSFLFVPFKYGLVQRVSPT